MPTGVFVRPPPKTVDERFWPKVCKKGTDDCWIWTGTLNKDGYGLITDPLRPKNSLRAHRVSLEMKLGRPIGEGLVARHTCDVRQCVNPNHLEEGTPRDNNNDKITRDRCARGEKHGCSKLSEEQVRTILESYDGTESYRSIGKRYGVSGQLIYRIIKRIVWIHIDS